jgi:hypothetical protein
VNQLEHRVAALEAEVLALRRREVLIFRLLRLEQAEIELLEKQVRPDAYPRPVVLNVRSP